jgi:hypothetical protein
MHAARPTADINTSLSIVPRFYVFSTRRPIGTLQLAGSEAIIPGRAEKGNLVQEQVETSEFFRNSEVLIVADKLIGFIPSARPDAGGGPLAFS